MTTASPSTQLREALIAKLKADAGVQASALGATPRVWNVAPPSSDPRARLPFLVVQDETSAWDTGSERGAEHAISLYVMGERMGHDEGEAIFQATQAALRDWAPQTLSAHRLVNLIFRGQDIRSEEDGKRYYGRQRWRAVTEEN